MFQQQRENLEGPASETDFATVLAEFTGAKINMVGVETKPTFMRKLVGHWRKLGKGVYSRGGGNSSWRKAEWYKYSEVNVLRLYLPCANKGLPMH
jgi:hypothetical protein